MYIYTHTPPAYDLMISLILRASDLMTSFSLEVYLMISPPPSSSLDARTSQIGIARPLFVRPTRYVVRVSNTDTASTPSPRAPPGDLAAHPLLLYVPNCVKY